MSVANGDIFPADSATNKILEPHKSNCYPIFPGVTGGSGMFRRRKQKGSYRIQYSYENLMAWEYRLIRSFFHTRKGMYDDFYVVDWGDRYVCTTAPTTDTIVLDRVDFLVDSIGYLGNTILLYNTSIWDGSEQELFQILTIDNDSIEDTEFTVTPHAEYGESVYEQLQVTTTYVYPVYPAIFDMDTLQPDAVDKCMDTNTHLFPGFGTKSMFGEIANVNVSFIALGSIKDS